ncbi:hypothetical protein ACTXT7_005349 [Hymenolepis weldensis]
MYHDLPPVEAQKQCLKELDTPHPIGVCHCNECTKSRTINNAPSENENGDKSNQYLTYLSDL